MPLSTLVQDSPSQLNKKLKVKQKTNLFLEKETGVKAHNTIQSTTRNLSSGERGKRSLRSRL